MQSVRSQLRVDDADVVGVAVVEPAERDPAERRLPVVAVGEPVDGDEAQPPQEDGFVGDLLHDAALQRGLRLVGEIHECECHGEFLSS
jgi:hypothetical protein